MLKITSLSLMTAMFLFTGCGSNDTLLNPVSEKPTQQEETTQDKTTVKVSKTTIEAGKTVDFTLSNTKNIKSIEWRDKNGKLLSTDLKFNRLFISEGEYETVLVVTDKDDKVTTDNIIVKVTKNSIPVNVTPNQLPIAKAKAQSLSIMDEEYIHLSDDGSYDPDGNIASYEWRDMDGILLSNTTKLDRKMYYYPQYDFNNDGTTRYVKTLIVTDDKGATATKSFTIIVNKNPLSNQAPTALAQSITLDKDTTKTIILSGTDPDGDDLTYTVTSPSNGKLSGIAPNLTYTPNTNYNGNDSFTYTVNDSKVDSTPALVSITIENNSASNQVPVANTQTVTLEQSNKKYIMLTGSDADNDTLTYTIVTPPSHGKITYFRPSEIFYVPDFEYYGTDSFTIKVNDGKVDSTPATISLNIVKQESNVYTFSMDNYGIIDKNANLMWQTNLIYRWTWDSAVEHCRILDYSGFTDWRLPTVIEYNELHDNVINDPDYSEFDYAEYMGVSNWTATEVSGHPDKAWAVYGVAGNNKEYYKASDYPKDISFKSQCVRELN